MIGYMLLGASIAIAGGLAASLFWLKKQKYEQLLQDMGKKHEVEKIIQEDRIQELQNCIKALQQNEDMDSKYRNSQGFFSYKKAVANGNTEDDK